VANQTRTIWKKQLPNKGQNIVYVPEGYEILHVAEQNDNVCMWYCCEPGNPLVECKVFVIHTADLIPDNGRYIGTAISKSGNLVHHAFVIS
jgi:hypothetical protein